MLKLSIYRLLWLAGFGLAPFFTAISDGDISGATSMAEFGEALYKDGFAHFPYVNPDAPKGGQIVMGSFGTYDSLNSYILKGNYPRSLGLTQDSLMAGSGDEILGTYAYIAESVDYPGDRSWIIFHLRSQAVYHDGVAITAGDFVFALNTIKQHGRPFLRAFYSEVEAVEAIDEQTLKFSFSTKDTMKPLMKVAGLSPLPRHYWQDRDISKTTLKPPLGSGQYRIKSLEPGRSITYERVQDYWANELPANIGGANFDLIRYDYYRDFDVMFEAFKAGEIDYWTEGQSKRWATGYDIPQIKNHLIIKETVADPQPQGIQAYFFNLRRNKFKDLRVREGISLLFDFETIRRTVLFNQYTRTTSYFPNSDYGAAGPPTAAELAVMQPYKDKLRAQILSEAFKPSTTDGSGRIRRQLRQALALFKAAGWNIVKGKLVNAEGKQMQAEFLIRQPSGERILAPFVQNLKKAGIDARIRLVDTSQYENRIDEFDFDILSVKLNFFPPPGPELRSYYGSAAANEKGSANLAGIQHPVVDELIEKIIHAGDLETLKVHTRVMDRILLWNHYVIPEFHNDVARIAYWNKFSRPATKPKYGVGFLGTWWLDDEKAKKLKK